MARTTKTKAPSKSTVSEPSPTETQPEFAVGTAEPTTGVESPLKPKSTRARKTKPCDRCDERRRREREYARASRQRVKGASVEKGAEGAAAELSPCDAAAATTPPDANAVAQ